jgi:predicted anti-sigma-YlaC factor YlaD
VANFRVHPQQSVEGKGPGIDCIDIVNMLGDYLDGDLSPETAHRCQHHFSECSYCRRLFEEYCTTISVASELRDIPPPADVRTRLRSRLLEHLRSGSQK